jgi:hypothetical protein
VHPQKPQGLLDAIFYDNPETRYKKPNPSIFNTGPGENEITFDKILELYRSQYEMMGYARLNDQQRRTSLALKNAKITLQHIYSNYILIPKSFITGISGFVCPKCIKFEAIYIQNLWLDRTMQHRHICHPSDLEIAVKNPDYKSILPAVNSEAKEELFVMTKNWHSGALFLNSRELLPSDHISPEVYVLDASSEDWLLEYRREKRRQINDLDLSKFLAQAKATYAVLKFSDKAMFSMFVSP